MLEAGGWLQVLCSSKADAAIDRCKVKHGIRSCSLPDVDGARGASPPEGPAHKRRPYPRITERQYFLSLEQTTGRKTGICFASSRRGRELTKNLLRTNASRLKLLEAALALCDLAATKKQNKSCPVDSSCLKCDHRPASLYLHGSTRFLGIPSLPPKVR